MDKKKSIRSGRSAESVNNEERMR